MSLGATFNASLVHAIGVVVGQEALAKHWGKDHSNALSFFAPNINIVRDVRWGRAQETYGEDPTLTGKLGTAYVMGMQYLGGNTSAPLAVRNVAKHFAGELLSQSLALSSSTPPFSHPSHSRPFSPRTCHSRPFSCSVQSGVELCREEDQEGNIGRGRTVQTAVRR
jgi:hypothetical protein